MPALEEVLHSFLVHCRRNRVEQKERVKRACGPHLLGGGSCAPNEMHDVLNRRLGVGRILTLSSLEDNRLLLLHQEGVCAALKEVVVGV